MDERIESETRRGRDCVRVTIALTVDAPDGAWALAAAWSAFFLAATDDVAGWDMASATAEVREQAGCLTISGAMAPAEPPQIRGSQVGLVPCRAGRLAGN